MYSTKTGGTTRLFWLNTDGGDMATYLFVHLNIEPVGHLVVLQAKEKTKR